MPQAELQTDRIDTQEEDARLAALDSTGILDSEPEPSFDTITRLAAEYFKADTVLLGFADESRVWIKSYWGEPVRELPRKGSVFEMVLADDGPVVVPDVSKHPYFTGGRLMIRRLEVASFASAPIRSGDGKILGALTVFGCQPRRKMAAEELHMLESLADIVTSQLELRKMRKTFGKGAAAECARAQSGDRDLAVQIGPAARAGQAAVCALLPAGSRARHAQDRRAGSADPLAASGAGIDSADGLHSAGRGKRADSAHRRLGTFGGLQPDSAMVPRGSRSGCAARLRESFGAAIRARRACRPRGSAAAPVGSLEPATWIGDDRVQPHLGPRHGHWRCWAACGGSGFRC